MGNYKEAIKYLGKLKSFDSKTAEKEIKRVRLEETGSLLKKAVRNE